MPFGRCASVKYANKWDLSASRAVRDDVLYVLLPGLELQICAWTKLLGFSYRYRDPGR